MQLNRDNTVFRNVDQGDIATVGLKRLTHNLNNLNYLNAINSHVNLSILGGRTQVLYAY